MIYHIFANRSNVGDWLSAIGIQKLLGIPVAECLCDMPFIAETFALLNNARANDLIVIGGGGLLMDYFQPFWEGFQQVAERVPFVIWGVGCCMMKWGDTRPSRNLMREISKRSRLCVVRDALTRDFLGSSEDYVPCPSFAALNGIASSGGGVLHSASYEEDHPEPYHAMREAAEALATRTGRPYWETNNRLSTIKLEELDRVVSLYARADLVLSARLHGCIIALALGRNLLAVSCDRKIESFMNSAGLSEWALDYNELDHIPERLERACNQPSAVDFVREARSANEGIARRILKLYDDLSAT